MDNTHDHPDEASNDSSSLDRKIDNWLTTGKASAASLAPHESPDNGEDQTPEGAPLSLNQTDANSAISTPPHVDYVKLFRMPQAVKIMGRTSSITNSFINSIIPVVAPTSQEILEALTILGMLDAVTCSYCGDQWTEWDHLRPLVVNKQPTGYISEIHNLVPACGKCNQSKGNKEWRQWLFGPAALSPRTRGTHDLEARAERLVSYESWKPPTRLNFAELVGHELWTKHWDNHRQLIELMRKAQETASVIRETVRETYLHVVEDGQ